MEADDDGHGDDGEVHGETQPGEKGAFVGAVVAGVGGGVFEEEGAGDGGGGEDVFGLGVGFGVLGLSGIVSI